MAKNPDWRHDESVPGFVERFAPKDLSDEDVPEPADRDGVLIRSDVVEIFSSQTRARTRKLSSPTTPLRSPANDTALARRLDPKRAIARPEPLPREKPKRNPWWLAARTLGMSLEEYSRNRENGLRWCYRCRAFVTPPVYTGLCVTHSREAQRERSRRQEHPKKEVDYVTRSRKAAATRLGVSYSDYIDAMREGKSRCWVCRSFQFDVDFGICRPCKLVQERDRRRRKREGQ